MRYRNEKTGAEIETPVPLRGGDWVPVNDESESEGSTREAPPSPATSPAAEEEPAEEESTEENTAEAPKPKRTRKAPQK